uniref:Uncharacterized protein n=1 Tax=Anguilla anguilla TaxID=7936 RepID=A0A0E9QTY4_ANGAN
MNTRFLVKIRNLRTSCFFIA